GENRRCRTKSAYLLGAAGYDAEAIVASGGLASHLGERYGTEARFVTDILAGDPSLGKPIVAGLPYLEAEVVYSARHEMARSVDDILSRRTRARMMARDASAAAAERVGELLMKELDLPALEVEAQVASYRNQTAHERAILMGEK
ncbi:MAG: glycerol-3-phosphate dehydrogenase C-terminal domain-containing protein, partial [Specibacter sp.]